jgi:hypothetical protein
MASRFFRFLLYSAELLEAPRCKKSESADTRRRGVLVAESMRRPDR